jgi:hypothetical protein
MAHYWLCSYMQKKIDTDETTGKCLFQNCRCEHLQLKSEEGKRCERNGILQTQLMVKL